MELKQFVKNVLKDLVEAVEEVRLESSRDMRLDSEDKGRTIDFDIAVAVEDAMKGEGSAGIRVFQFLEGNGGLSTELKNSTVSRVKFGVTVARWNKEEQEQRSQNMGKSSPGRLISFWSVHGILN